MSDLSQSAFVFPGQGSQKVGMLAELGGARSIIRETFAEASDVLGYDLWKLVQEGPQEDLNLTEMSQPALLVSSVAIWRAIHEQKDVTAKVLAGHSLGEWTALVCADVLSFKEAVRSVQLRGRFMQKAVPVGVGSMAAIIGLENEAVQQACENAAENEYVVPVNYNSPGQVVIAGHVGAVNRAIEQCKEAGARKAMPLAVSAPFHTELMKPAAEALQEHLSTIQFNPAKIPVVHNVHAQTESDPEAIKALMIQQICMPVLWVDCVNALSKTGVQSYVECGPGKVLSGLIKRIQKGAVVMASDSSALLENLRQS